MAHFSVQKALSYKTKWTLLKSHKYAIIKATMAEKEVTLLRLSFFQRLNLKYLLSLHQDRLRLGNLKQVSLHSTCTVFASR